MRKAPGCVRDSTDEIMTMWEQLIICTYFMLSTLSTVGYGDFYPSSMSEKLFGILIQFGGVTIFSIVMN
jgi:hypothetical protein